MKEKLPSVGKRVRFRQGLAARRICQIWDGFNNGSRFFIRYYSKPLLLMSWHYPELLQTLAVLKSTHFPQIEEASTPRPCF